MEHKNDYRSVISLKVEAGFIKFFALNSNQQITEPIKIPHNSDQYNLDYIVNGIKKVIPKIDSKPVAISFALPGLVGYTNGIIESNNSFKLAQDRIALGASLENIFGVPTYINRPIDLFAYGEYLDGFLPYVNKMFEEHDIPKKFNNLIAINLSDEVKAGIITNGSIYKGDNLLNGELGRIKNKIDPVMNLNYSVSSQGLRHNFANYSGINMKDIPEVEKIVSIAKDNNSNSDAAQMAVFNLGSALGDALAMTLSIIDGLIVIGGPLTKAYDLFMPQAVREMNSTCRNCKGEHIKRLQMEVFNLENKKQLEEFTINNSIKLTVRDTDKSIKYDPINRIGVGRTKLGMNKAINYGAYAYAINSISAKTG